MDIVYCLKCFTFVSFSKKVCYWWNACLNCKSQEREQRESLFFVPFLKSAVFSRSQNRPFGPFLNRLFCPVLKYCFVPHPRELPRNSVDGFLFVICMQVPSLKSLRLTVTDRTQLEGFDMVWIDFYSNFHQSYQELLVSSDMFKIKYLVLQLTGANITCPVSLENLS